MPSNPFTTAVIRGIYSTRQVFINGKELLPDRSQRVINHSPDGFNWSYGGSGPAQAALAIMLELLEDEEQAVLVYQDFKWRLLANIPPQNFRFEIDMPSLKTWVKNQIEYNHKGGAYKQNRVSTFKKSN